MSKIGIDVRLTYYRDGGISTYIKRLVEALANSVSSHQFTLFHSRKDQQTLNQAFKRVGLWTPAHHRLERIALSAELAWRGLDLFHSPDFIPPYRGAKSHIITVHDLTFLHYPEYLTVDSRRYYNQQIETACQHADHILAVSDATRRDLMSMLQVPFDKITVQPHGVSEQYQPMPVTVTKPIIDALGLPDRYFLHVGTWEPRKNIIGLVQAYQQLLKQYPDAPPVVLVGRKGWLFEQTQKEIETLGLGEKVIWCDRVGDAQLPAIYNHALALISPSWYEGFGMPALEAMACAVIPIASNLSSFPEVLGDTGILIEPSNPDSITQAMLKILNDTEWVQVQSQRCLERSKQFTWERSAQIALQTYTAFA